MIAAAPSRYATSHALYDLTLDVDGAPVDLVLKDLAPDAVLPEARGRCPEFLDDPRREIVVYTELLASADLGTARCHAAGDHWLLLEKVPGVELYQVGELGPWQATGAWLARFHGALAGAVDEAPAVLLRHDPRFHRRWAERAAQFNDDPRMRWVLDRHPDVVEAVTALPSTIVHGDCWASNVLVDGDRVCPVDWERAAVGTGVLDLAALSMGWPERQRAEIALAYHAALGPDAPDRATFLADVDRCAVLWCVQWLGWAPGWVAPPEHRKDWLATAVDLLERLPS